MARFRDTGRMSPVARKREWTSACRSPAECREHRGNPCKRRRQSTGYEQTVHARNPDMSPRACLEVRTSIELQGGHDTQDTATGRSGGDEWAMPDCCSEVPHVPRGSRNRPALRERRALPHVRATIQDTPALLSGGTARMFWPAPGATRGKPRSPGRESRARHGSRRTLRDWGHARFQDKSRRRHDAEPSIPRRANGRPGTWRPLRSCWFAIREPCSGECRACHGTKRRSDHRLRNRESSGGDRFLHRRGRMSI